MRNRNRAVRAVRRGVVEAMEDRRLLSVSIPANYVKVETIDVDAKTAGDQGFAAELTAGAAYYVVSGKPDGSGGYTPGSIYGNTAGIGLFKQGTIATINDFGLPVTATTNSFTGLNVTNGVAHFTDLFEIFAVESPPYTGNDLIPQSITVTFNFTSPAIVSGIVSGTTVGVIGDDAFLHWAGPINLIFPTGKLTISLSDAPFGDFFNGVVIAQFVPEPGTLALFAIGLVGAFSLRSRKAART